MIRAKPVTVVMYVIVSFYIIIIGIVCSFLLLTGVKLKHILFILDRHPVGGEKEKKLICSLVHLP
jgi:hypothetical protein